jgi:phenylalanyl-tRNA synthetase beta chain
VLDGTPVACFGQLHPDVAAARKLKQEIWLAEFDLEALYLFALRTPRFEPLPRYPAVERDFSFLFPESVAFEAMEHAVRGLKLRELRGFEPVEIFRGGSVPAGHYSMLLRATLQSADHTLREEEVAQWSAQIIPALEALGGRQRA